MYRYEVQVGEQRLVVELVPRGTGWAAKVGDRTHELRLLHGSPRGNLTVELDGQRLELALDADEGAPGRVLLDELLVRNAPLPAAAQGAASSKPVLLFPVPSPMAGVVQEVLVHQGQVVERGDRLMIIEAMKMENTIHAPASGRVAALAVQERKSVLKGQSLLELQALEEKP